MSRDTKMRFDADDPRLSAYAFGELEGAEAAAVETLLAQSPEARAFVDELRATADALKAGLATEVAAAPGLDEARRERVDSEVATSKAPRKPALYARTIRWAAAAMILIAVGVVMKAGISGGGGADGGGWFERRASRGTVAEHAAPASKPMAPYGIAEGEFAHRALGSPFDNPAAPEPKPADLPPQELAAIPEVAGIADQLEVMQTVIGETRATNPDVQKRILEAGVELKVLREQLRRDPNVSKEKAAELRGRIEQIRQQVEASNTEDYARIVDNPFLVALDNPLSTFSIDVDTASYANVRRYLTQGALPPKDAVRIEELLNTFSYADPEPEGGKPLAMRAEIASCPWNLKHRLMRVSLKARSVDLAHRPPSNLVFLIDVSGSMNEENKLPLVKESLRLLLGTLGENDRVALVVYAGAAGLVLPSTSCDKKGEVLAAIDLLSAGGSTNGGQGIQLAYDVAAANFIRGGVNRVILATDGDFNVGVSDQGSLIRLIEEKAKTGVFLSVLGYGMGNLKDATLEKLADKGNGNYAYIDSREEARKLLVREMAGTLITLAKDVKIQIEFNPSRVASYRLIGYENRLLAKEDFADDTKDAGEVGMGHSVTALYELVPADGDLKVGPGVPLRYQPPPTPTNAATSDELGLLKLRWKEPEGSTSALDETPIRDAPTRFDAASEDFRFSSAVAAFGMLLRESPYKGTANWATVLELATGALGKDPHGDRAAFLDLARKASALPVR